jgi:hypothetical protein
MPKYHGARKAEHLGPCVALFKKSLPFSWLSSSPTDARRRVSADLHLFVDSLGVRLRSWMRTVASVTLLGFRVGFDLAPDWTPSM